MSEILIGAVENGTTRQVAFPFYTGTVGFKDLGNETVAFSFLGPVPTSKMVGDAGLIGGDPYIITRADRVRGAGVVTLIATSRPAR